MNIQLSTISSILNAAHSIESETPITPRQDASISECVIEAAKILQKAIHKDRLIELTKQDVKFIELTELTEKERHIISQAEQFLFPKTQNPITLYDVLPESKNQDHPLHQWSQIPFEHSIQQLDFWGTITKSNLSFLQIAQTFRREFPKIDFVSNLRSCYLVSLAQETKLNALFNILTLVEPNLILEKEENGYNVFENTIKDGNEELLQYIVGVIKGEERLKMRLYDTKEDRTPSIMLVEKFSDPIVYYLLYNYPPHLFAQHLENLNFADIGLFLFYYERWFPPLDDKTMLRLAEVSCCDFIKDITKHASTSSIADRFEIFFFDTFKLFDRDEKTLKEKLAKKEQLFTLTDGKPLIDLLSSPKDEKALTQLVKIYPEDLLFEHLEKEALINPFVVVEALRTTPFADKNLENLAKIVCKSYVDMFNTHPYMAYLIDILNRYLNLDLSVFHLPKEIEDMLLQDINGCKKQYSDLFISKGSLRESSFKNKFSEINFKQSKAGMEVELGFFGRKYKKSIPEALTNNSECLLGLMAAGQMMKSLNPQTKASLKEVAIESERLQDSIQKVLGDETIQFAVYPMGTPNHMMLLIKQGETYRFFDPNLGIVASKKLDSLSEFVSHFINKTYFQIGDLVNPSNDIVFEQLSEQFPDFLSVPEGVCAAWCLDFAEQLTKKNREGVNFDQINLKDFSYARFEALTYYLQRGYALLERGQFERASGLFAIAFKIAPMNLSVQINRLFLDGKLAYFKGDFSTAYDKLTQTQNILNEHKHIFYETTKEFYDSKDLEIQLCEGFLQLSKGEYEEARKHFLAYPNNKASIHGLKACQQLNPSHISEVKEEEIEEILNFFLNFSFEEKPHELFFQALEVGQARFPKNAYFVLAKHLTTTFSKKRLAELERNIVKDRASEFRAIETVFQDLKKSKSVKIHRKLNNQMKSLSEKMDQLERVYVGENPFKQKGQMSNFMKSFPNLGMEVLLKNQNAEFFDEAYSICLSKEVDEGLRQKIKTLLADNAKFVENVKKYYEGRLKHILEDPQSTKPMKEQSKNIQDKIELLFSKIEPEELEEALSKMEMEFYNFKASPHTSSGLYYVAFFDIAFANLNK